MKYSKVVALLLVGLVTAEVSSNNLDADPRSVIEARAKKPKAPATPNPAKTPTNPQPPSDPQPPTKPSGSKPKPTPDGPEPKPTPNKPKAKPTPNKPKPTPTPKNIPQPTPSPALKGPFTNHVVYAIKPTDKSGNARLKKLLAKHVKNPAKDIKELGIKGKHINYWELPLNAQSVRELRKNKQVFLRVPLKSWYEKY
jgi:outer membrane biosynthesis protein TonB